MLRLPYLHEATIIRPRHRTAEPYVAKAYGAFDIPEVGSLEAPLAVEWVQNDSYARYGEEAFPHGPNRRVTRFHEGRHYGAVGADVTPSAYEAAHGLGGDGRLLSDFPVQEGLTHHGGDPYDRVRHSLDDLMAHLADGRTKPRLRSEDSVARLAQASVLFPRTLLVADGTMWSAQGVREPHYEVVVVDGPHRRVEVDVSQAPVDDANVLPYVHAFRADRRDDALAFAERHARRLGVAVKVTADELTVLHAPSVVLDQGVAIAVQLAKGVTAYANEFEVRPAAPDVVRCVRDVQALRDEPDRDVRWAARVVAAFEALVAAVDDDPLSGPDRFGLDRLVDSAARWRDLERPVQSDLRPMDEDDLREVEGLSF